jgi:hypothetical protein
LARGQIHIQYGDGCTQEFVAPQAVAIEPGHDGWVVGDGPAVLIEFDFEGDTISRLGMLEVHRHVLQAAKYHLERAIRVISQEERAGQESKREG